MANRTHEKGTVGKQTDFVGVVRPVPKVVKGGAKKPGWQKPAPQAASYGAFKPPEPQGPPPGAGGSNFCSNCGNSVRGMKFCAGCGNPAGASVGAAPSAPKPAGVSTYKPLAKPFSQPAQDSYAPAAGTTHTGYTAPKHAPVSTYKPLAKAYSQPAQNSYAPAAGTTHTGYKAPGASASRPVAPHVPRNVPAPAQVQAMRHAQNQASFGDGQINHAHARAQGAVQGGLHKTTYEKQPAWAYAEQHKNVAGQYRPGMFNNK